MLEYIADRGKQLVRLEELAVLAQSVARRLGKAEVGGSSPLDSFVIFIKRTERRAFRGIGLRKAFFLPLPTKRRDAVGS